MPKFAANLTMLFNEVPFLDRFVAAADAGFHASSQWSNPEPEAVLIVASDGRIVGATLGNVLARLLGLPLDLGAGIGLAAVFAAASNTPIALSIMALGVAVPDLELSPKTLLLALALPFMCASLLVTEIS